MTAILIQSRLNSVRLPQKALLPLGDSTVLGQVIRRAKKSSIDKVIVITQDQPIIDIAIAEGVEYSRFISGKRDVLAEFYCAAKTFGVDTIVRITGDCPCVSPKEINQMVEFFDKESCDIICNHSDSLGGIGIDGLDIEVFSFSALERAYKEATDDSDREHVCFWMYRNLKSQRVACCWDFDAKLSIDTISDYLFVCEIFEKLGNDFEIRELIKYFKEKKNENSC